jgi:hypothetical protein
MICAQGLDLEFWAEAVNTAVYIKNRCPAKAFESKTPEEAWTGRKPDVSIGNYNGYIQMIEMVQSYNYNL